MNKTIKSISSKMLMLAVILCVYFFVCVVGVFVLCRQVITEPVE